MKKPPLFRWVTVLALPLAGCTVGPNYHEPNMQVPAGFAEAPRAAPGEAAIPPEGIATWWKDFGDPKLDELVARALVASPDMGTAASRVREARLQEIVAGAPFWPSLDATGTGERIKESKNSIPIGDLGALSGLGGSGGTGSSTGSQTGFNIGSIGLPGSEFNTFQVGFDASWQLDFFGKTRRGVEAAKADTMAQIWSMRDTEVSLAAEVAGTYLGVRFTEERARIARSELERLEQTLHLLEVRATGGMASQLDVRQQQAEVASTAAGLPPLEAQVKTQTHALAVLLGQAPEDFVLEPASAAPPPAPREVPVGLPSELLRRRPDIRQAERQLASTNAKIGVAVADLYPQFSLTASPTLSSTTLRNLATAGSFGYNVGGSIVWPLFNGGQTRANIGVANERQRQALIAYGKTILTALKEVDDALTNFAADQRRLESLEQSATFSEAAERLAREQYQGGLVDFSRVLTAEGTHLTADDDLAQGRAAIAQDWVALYKALGGGWREDDLAHEAHSDHATKDASS